jgi:hypothetical protein
MSVRASLYMITTNQAAHGLIQRVHIVFNSSIHWPFIVFIHRMFTKKLPDSWPSGSKEKLLVLEN